MPLSCRFYKKKFPDIEDTVMVTITEITTVGAYVYLKEYNNMCGMMLLSELSRRRIRSVNKLIRVGKTEPVVVIRVNSEKGYIDLSKRRVTPENTAECNERYSKGKAVQSILRRVAEVCNYETDEELENLYEKTAWLFESKTGKCGSSYDFFKRAVTDSSVLDICPIDEETKLILINQIKQKLMTQAVKIRADIEVRCSTYDGIDAIKAALKAGLCLSTEEIPLKINLISHPVFVVVTTTHNVSEGLLMLSQACDAIKESIEECGGKFDMKMAPKVVTEVDEVDYQKQLENADAEQREVPDDSDSEEEEAESD